MTEEKLEKATELKRSIVTYNDIIEMLNDQNEKQEKILMNVLWGNRSTYGHLKDLLDISVVDDIERIIKHNLVDKRDKLVKQFKEL